MPWRDGRAAEGGGLENRSPATDRGFESPSLRRSRQLPGEGYAWAHPYSRRYGAGSGRITRRVADRSSGALQIEHVERWISSTGE